MHSRYLIFTVLTDRRVSALLSTLTIGGCFEKADVLSTSSLKITEERCASISYSTAPEAINKRCDVLQSWLGLVPTSVKQQPTAGGQPDMDRQEPESHSTTNEIVPASISGYQLSRQMENRPEASVLDLSKETTATLNAIREKYRREEFETVSRHWRNLQADVNKLLRLLEERITKCPQ